MEKTNRFELVSASSPDALVDKLNDIGKEIYIVVLHVYEEKDPQGSSSLWRALIDYAIPAVMPVPMQEEERTYSVNAA